MTDALREAFEKWITDPPYESQVDRYPDDPNKVAWPGHYQDITVQLAWEAWQEGLCTALQEPAPAVARERVRFNVNDYVRVKLNDTGRAIHRQIWEGIRERHPKIGPYTPKKEDAEGWSRWQLWNLMQDFGPHITLGGLVPFDTQIEFEVAARSAGQIPTGGRQAPDDGDPCRLCKGSGRLPWNVKVLCPDCSGSGRSPTTRPERQNNE